MQIASVATVSGWITSVEPSRIATVSGLPSVWLRWMFSIVTVALSTSRPIASARPPSVIRLMVWPVRNSPTMPAKIDSGIEIETITVFRQLPRNTRIISETRIDEMIASWTTFSTAARTNTDWSKSSFSSRPVRRRRLDLRQHVARGVDHGERRGVGVLQDGQVDRALAVDAHDVGLRGEAVADLGDVAERDRRAVADADRQRVELVDRAAGWS